MFRNLFNLSKQKSTTTATTNELKSIIIDSSNIVQQSPQSTAATTTTLQSSSMNIKNDEISNHNNINNGQKKSIEIIVIDDDDDDDDDNDDNEEDDDDNNNNEINDNFDNSQSNNDDEKNIDPNENVEIITNKLKDSAIDDLIGKSWYDLNVFLSNHTQSDDLFTSDSDDNDNDNNIKSDCTKLPIEDVDLFGRGNNSEPLLTAKCKACNRLIKASEFRRHTEIRHPNMINGDDSSKSDIDIDKPNDSDNLKSDTNINKLNMGDNFSNLDKSEISIKHLNIGDNSMNINDKSDAGINYGYNNRGNMDKKIYDVYLLKKRTKSIKNKNRIDNNNEIEWYDIQKSDNNKLILRSRSKTMKKSNTYLNMENESLLDGFGYCETQSLNNDRVSNYKRFNDQKSDNDKLMLRSRGKTSKKSNEYSNIDNKRISHRKKMLDNSQNAQAQKLSNLNDVDDECAITNRFDLQSIKSNLDIDSKDSSNFSSMTKTLMIKPKNQSNLKQQQQPQPQQQSICTTMPMKSAQSMNNNNNNTGNFTVIKGVYCGNNLTKANQILPVSAIKSQETYGPHSPTPRSNSLLRSSSLTKRSSLLHDKDNSSNKKSKYTENNALSKPTSVAITTATTTNAGGQTQQVIMVQTSMLPSLAKQITENNDIIIKQNTVINDNKSNTQSSSTNRASSPMLMPPPPSPVVPKKRTVILCKYREYDPDQHCGVQLPDMDRPCTRSLTCRCHLISLRRKVLGRSKSFDELLSEYKRAHNMKERRDRRKNKSDHQNNDNNRTRQKSSAESLQQQQQYAMTQYQSNQSAGSSILSHRRFNDTIENTNLMQQDVIYTEDEEKENLELIKRINLPLGRPMSIPCGETMEYLNGKSMRNILQTVEFPCLIENRVGNICKNANSRLQNLLKNKRKTDEFNEKIAKTNNSDKDRKLLHETIEKRSDNFEIYRIDHFPRPAAVQSTYDNSIFPIYFKTESEKFIKFESTIDSYNHPLIAGLDLDLDDFDSKMKHNEIYMKTNSKQSTKTVLKRFSSELDDVLIDVEDENDDGIRSKRPKLTTTIVKIAEDKSIDDDRKLLSPKLSFNEFECTKKMKSDSILSSTTRNMRIMNDLKMNDTAIDVNGPQQQLQATNRSNIKLLKPTSMPEATNIVKNIKDLSIDNDEMSKQYNSNVTATVSNFKSNKKMNKSLLKTNQYSSIGLSVDNMDSNTNSNSILKNELSDRIKSTIQIDDMTNNDINVNNISSENKNNHNQSIFIKESSLPKQETMDKHDSNKKPIKFLFVNSGSNIRLLLPLDSKDKGVFIDSNDNDDVESISSVSSSPSSIATTKNSNVMTTSAATPLRTTMTVADNKCKYDFDFENESMEACDKYIIDLLLELENEFPSNIVRDHENPPKEWGIMKCLDTSSIMNVTTKQNKQVNHPKPVESFRSIPSVVNNNNNNNNKASRPIIESNLINFSPKNETLIKEKSSDAAFTKHVNSKSILDVNKMPNSLKSNEKPVTEANNLPKTNEKSVVTVTKPSEKPIIVPIISNATGFQQQKLPTNHLQQQQQQLYQTFQIKPTNQNNVNNINLISTGTPIGNIAQLLQSSSAPSSSSSIISTPIITTTTTTTATPATTIPMTATNQQPQQQQFAIPLAIQNNGQTFLLPISSFNNIFILQPSSTSSSTSTTTTTAPLSIGKQSSKTLKK